jgi:hypothetical protein
MRLLITGIPGAGKTQFGEYLVSTHRFEHRDLENPDEFAKFVENPTNYLQKLSARGRKPVITWDFFAGAKCIWPYSVPDRADYWLAATQMVRRTNPPWRNSYFMD